MSTTTSSTTSTTTTAQQPIDYLGLLGTLNPAPFDPNTVINALINADSLPIKNLQAQIATQNTIATVYGNIGNDVSALQSAVFSLTLQSTVQANAATSSNAAAVTAQAGPNVQPGTYTVAVNKLATSTTATSTAAVGQAIDSVAGTTPLSSLNLSATPTAGAFSVVVDGKVQTVNVDPTKALTDPSGGALTQLQSVLASALSGDAGAQVTVGVSGNKVQIGITGATASHTISFGATGDTSNFLSAMNLTTTQGTTTNGSLTLSSSANVGVAQTNATLTQAGLATGINATNGTFSINGVSIAWNAATDSINSVINTINNSAAGVTAQYNTVTDQMVLTNKATGQSAITLQDTTGNFLAAMNLAPGTTNAQKLGANASVTVNGTTVSSASNTITNAVPGLSINALALTNGTPATLTVAPDSTGITKQVQTFVDAANKVIGDIDATQVKDPTSGKYGPLFGDTTLEGLKYQVLTLVTSQVTKTGVYQSLQDIGITTGSVGSQPGTTNSLTLDTTKLAAAIAANPGQVAALFNGTTANNGFQGAAQQLNSYLDQIANPVTGAFALEQSTTSTQIKNFNSQIAQLQLNLTEQRAILTSQFSAMETALVALSTQNGALGALGGLSGSSSSNSSSNGSSGSSGG